MRSIQEIMNGSGFNKEDFDAFWFACYFSYPFFAKHVFGFKVGDFHEEWANLCEKFKRVAIIAHRGSGKTFWFAGYFVWRAVFFRDEEYLIVSNSLEHSKYILKVVKSLITENELLKQLAPSDRNQTWRQTEITTSTNCTFYIRTFSENIRGLHPNFIFCDEGQNYENKSIFWQVISPTVQLKNGKIFVVGTTRSFGDLLMELYNENDEYFSKKYPAIIKNEKGKEVPLWPEKYTLENKDIFKKISLPRIRREIGEINFEQEFMLNPVSSQTGLFPYELIQRNIDSSQGFLEFAQSNERYVIGMDIAYSKEVKGDFSVIIVLGIDPQRNKRIVYMDRFKGKSPNEQKSILKNIIGRFHPYRVIIDEKGVGEGFLRDLKEEVHTTQIEGKSYNQPEAKNDLLKSLRNEFENNRLTIPHNPEHAISYERINVLIKELEETGWVIKNNKAKIEGLGKHDDTVMALALANFASEGSVGKVSLSTLD